MSRYLLVFALGCSLGCPARQTRPQPKGANKKGASDEKKMLLMHESQQKRLRGADSETGRSLHHLQEPEEHGITPRAGDEREREVPGR